MVSAILSKWWLAAGYFAARTGDHDQALNYFDRADRATPGNPLVAGYRAIVLVRMRRGAEAEPAFRALAKNDKFDNPNYEYARLFAKMYVAYLEDKLVEADRLAAEMSRIDCRPTVKDLLTPIGRPSLLAANSRLSDFGIGEADPIAFRDDRTGVHWMKAVEAYSAGNLAEALAIIDEASAIRAPTSAQRAVTAAILLHFGRADEAASILREIRDQLGSPSDVDERYLRLFCDVYVPSVDVSSHARAVKEARELQPESDLRHFLAIGDDDEAETLIVYPKSLLTACEKRSFDISCPQSVQTAYEKRSLNISWSDT